MRADGISLNAVKVEKLPERTHSSLRERLHNLKQYKENKSLMDYFT